MDSRKVGLYVSLWLCLRISSSYVHGQWAYLYRIIIVFPVYLLLHKLYDVPLKPEKKNNNEK